MGWVPWTSLEWCILRSDSADSFKGGFITNIHCSNHFCILVFYHMYLEFVCKADQSELYTNKYYSPSDPGWAGVNYVTVAVLANGKWHRNKGWAFSSLWNIILLCIVKCMLGIDVWWWSNYSKHLRWDSNGRINSKVRHTHLWHLDFMWSNWVYVYFFSALYFGPQFDTKMNFDCFNK